MNPARSARAGLAVLTLINLFNYLDRWILPVLGETLRKSPLHISDTQFGLLASGFIVVYMLTAPFFGTLGDTGARTRLIALGIAIWSVATALGGFAWSFVSLFVARAIVGVGEAAYGTISPGLLADYFPRTHRGRAFGIFYTVIPIGGALGYLVAGQMDVHFGWRSAFFVAGIPGLVLAVAALRLHDPPRGVHDAGEYHGAVRPQGGIAAYRTLLSNRPYLLTVLGYAAYTFVMGGLVIFMPKFLMRVRGLPESAVSLKFSGVLAVTGLLGTFLGGWLGDRLLPRSRQAYLWLSGIATLLAVPCVALAIISPSPAVYWTANVLAITLMMISTGPINTAIVNQVPPDMRATAVAGSIFAIHVLGDVPSPTILGALSDLRSIDQAMLIMPVVVAIAGIIWTFAAWQGSRVETTG
ncbi:MAG TPA: MFS transporter [Gemmatimonadales bacterium]|nr:MFS transporter [Gemmatimonadales bacterium]